MILPESYTAHRGPLDDLPVPVAPGPADAWQRAPYASFICNVKGLFTHVNAAFEALTGYRASMLVGRLSYLDVLDESELRLRRSQFDALHTPHGPARLHEYFSYRRRDGGRLAVLLDVRLVRDAQGVPSGLLGTVMPHSAVSQQERARIWYLAHHDARTRLPNQTWVDERLALKIQRSRESGQRFAMAVIEADNLERVRNSLGAEALGPALVILADRLRAVMRPGDSLACVNGIQFVVISEEPPEAFEQRVAQWLKRLSQPISSLGKALRLTASAGLCRGEGSAEPAVMMLRAGLALAAAREQGGEQMRWFERGMQSRALSRLELEDMLRAALERREFRLVYQPQLNLASGEIRLMEALLRWQHPVRGPISPAEFIPVAESCGLIVELGSWVMDHACRQASLLLRRLGRTPVVSVNVSPLQIQNKDLVQVVERCLREHALDPRYLEIEVTEGVLLGDTQIAMQTLSALREMGVSVAIDDFGTGYSSLSYLARLQADRLKIDRSFIVEMLQDDKRAAIVSAITVMAHALDIRVTAEGVETQEQADTLQQLGCDDIQGYWFARPLAAESLEHVLAPL